MFGANVASGEVEFRVWAPKLQKLSVELNGSAFELSRNDADIFSGSLKAKAGDRYCYLVGDRRLPDPVSRLLPEGAHGRTEIVDPEAFEWSDESWTGLSFNEYVLYELHVGTFSPEGTFDGVINRLDYLRSLGVTAIEIMPVAAFPGERNWGYDGVSLYAVQASYGEPEGLKRLVNAAHHVGLAVVVDVVYNHLGAEGNYLREFGPYFTDRYHTVWGDAINYDDEGSQQVRKYVIENALYWIREYHIDGLRLDAIQAIYDSSKTHIIKELARDVQEFARGANRQIAVIAESDQNDRNLILPANEGGFGVDAVWSDDFHHSVHTFLTKENRGYYQDYGEPEKIVKALNEGFVFQGQHYRFWRASRGSSTDGIPLLRHVFCIQNHDQVGNRCNGERLAHLVPRGAVKAAAALLLLAPETPLLFMGEEYAEPAHFQFFTDYGDKNLQEAVVEGRKKEFEDFGWEETPNPQDPETFARSKLTWKTDDEMLAWYRQLLELRRKFVTHSPRTCRARLSDGAIVLEVPAQNSELILRVRFPGSGKYVGEKEGAEQVLLRSQEDGYETVIIKSERTPQAVQPNQAAAD
ncbi:MAG TPA: malto-oligosyltrehalose trehalohydrolase [Terriglobales bacterium]|jgi:maltooligosyltrehalose trehalohydrolase|nr:malto-oligosyltrehalose trehalohydrolase [Terriglobales bacterium]